MTRLLEVKDFTLYYRTRRGPLRAVDRVSLCVEKGECLAIVGESGCGKSSLALGLMRLLPKNIHTYTGSVIMDGVDLMKLGEDELRREFRLRRMAMVFQGAMNALNPVITVGHQIAEPLILNLGMSKHEALLRAGELLEHVRLPRSLIDKYPHELSGGMKQRVVIAMALVMNPELLILDEPTSALDVITQANIVNFLKQLREDRMLTYIFITHDLGLASDLSDTFAVMYAGEIVELGRSVDILTNPRHPYTQKLLAATPRIRSSSQLEFIPGSPPDLTQPPEGCRFNPRCPHAMDICRLRSPPSLKVGEGRVSCWLYSEGGAG